MTQATISPRLTGPLLWDLSERVDSASPSMIVFPFAGGSVFAFRHWEVAFPNLRVVAAQYPGRPGEPAPERQFTIEELASQVVAEWLRRCLPAPAILAGHSMGSLVAYEVAVRLAATGRPARLLCVSSAAAPGSHEGRAAGLSGPLHLLGEDDLAAALTEGGGLPAAILIEPDLLRSTLESVRRDVAAAWNYRLRPTGQLVDCDVLAVGGGDDPSVAPACLDAWASITTGRTTIQLLPGGHFYLQQQTSALAEAITAAARLHEGPRG